VHIGKQAVDNRARQLTIFLANNMLAMPE